MGVRISMRPLALFWLIVLASAAHRSADAAEVILYDFVNFGGASITLTDSAPDLDAYNFDNDVESIRVISGIWSFHRDDNFQNGNGPPITLGPGDYPNIQALNFPADRMSSVRLIQDDQPPPPDPVSCPQPYLVPSNGSCVFDCAVGTVPDAASRQCVCAQGFTEAGTDERGRRICGPYTVAPPPLQQAHWVSLTGLDIDGGAYQTADREVTLSTTVQTSPSLQGAALQYRAAEGPLVHHDGAMLQILSAAPWRDYRLPGTARLFPVTFQLSPGAGEKHVYFQVRARTQAAGGGVAWIESEPHVDTILYAPAEQATAIQRVPAGQAFQLAAERGFRFEAANSGSDRFRCFIQRNGQQLDLLAEYRAFRPPGMLAPPSLCSYRLFVDRSLAPGWSFDGRIELDPNACGRGSVSVSAPDGGLIVDIIVDFNYRPDILTTCLLHGWTLSTIGLRGPAGADWRQAFQ